MLLCGNVATTAKGIAAAFNPDEINYGAYEDSISLLHMHVVPKIKSKYGFGGVFEINPQKITMSDDEYAFL